MRQNLCKIRRLLTATAVVPLLLFSAGYADAQTRAVSGNSYGRSSSDERIAYIIDGKIVPKDSMIVVHPQTVSSINILSGVDKVVVINTKRKDSDHKSVKGTIYKSPARNSVKVSREVYGTIKLGSGANDRSEGEGILYNFQSDSDISTITPGEIEKLAVARAEFKKQWRNTTDSIRHSYRGTIKLPLKVVKYEDGSVGAVDLWDFAKSGIQSITVYKDSISTAPFKQYGDVSNGVVYIIMHQKEE